MTKGVLYVASHGKYIDEAIESVKSVKKHNNLDSALICSKDYENNIDCFTHVINVDTHCDVRDKALNLNKSPFDKTLYLDTDTHVIGDLNPVFELLERVDIAAARCNLKYLFDIKGVPTAFPQFNTGVIGYNSSIRSVELLKRWEKIYLTQIEEGRPNESIPVECDSIKNAVPFGLKTDQPAFREAIYKTNISYATLPAEYNFGSFGNSYAYGDVKIIHGSKRRQNTLINRINENTVPRIYVEPWHGKLIYDNGEVTNIFPLHIRLLNLIVRNLPVRKIANHFGIINTFRKLNRKIKH